MSHSIHMLSIQIDTKSFQYQFNNIKLSFFTGHTKRTFAVRLLEYLLMDENI